MMKTFTYKKDFSVCVCVWCGRAVFKPYFDTYIVSFSKARLSCPSRFLKRIVPTIILGQENVKTIVLTNISLIKRDFIR